VRPYIDESKCTNCGDCVLVCPYEVFEKENDRILVMTPADCIECIACVEECRQQAVYMDD